MPEILSAPNRVISVSDIKQRKYLIFCLGNEEYGLEILKVREIICYMDITPVPQMPSYVSGLINLRGQIIPVIDLRAKFSMAGTKITAESCIIIVELATQGRRFSTGLLVDRVLEVLDIAGENIQETPQLGINVNTDFILGIGKVGESVKLLLDINKVLATDIQSLNTSVQD